MSSTSRIWICLFKGLLILWNVFPCSFLNFLFWSFILTFVFLVVCVCVSLSRRVPVVLHGWSLVMVSMVMVPWWSPAFLKSACCCMQPQLSQSTQTSGVSPMWTCVLSVFLPPALAYLFFGHRLVTSPSDDWDMLSTVKERHRDTNCVFCILLRPSKLMTQSPEWLSDVMCLRCPTSLLQRSFLPDVWQPTTVPQSSMDKNCSARPVWHLL